MTHLRSGYLALVLLAVVAGVCGCQKAADTGIPDGPQKQQTNKICREKWGKSFDELPSEQLVLISPHNEDIRKEFTWAFSMWHARKYGKRVELVWRSVGGGTSAIQRYLENVYSKADTSEIDVVWGGGRFPFMAMEKASILVPIELPDDLKKTLFEQGNVPAELGGIPQLSRQEGKLYWVGTAVSGFGFLYNKGLLDRFGIAVPKTWADLGDKRFADMLVLADPTQSGSVAATYQTIAQSADTWPEGWAKLLGVLANAKRFADSSSDAANAPVLGEAPVATTIDFYGTNRAANSGGKLVYVSPKGETAFGPDPIAILKGAPHGELAQRFVAFTLSDWGQSMLALAPGSADGPIRTQLGRQPVRKDIYAKLAGKQLPGIVNPYEQGQSMQLDASKNGIDYGVLKALVGAAAIDNVEGLRAARKKLIATNYDPSRLAEFTRLPDNVATLAAIAQTKKRLRGSDKERDEVISAWRKFFREKYAKVAR